MVSCFLPGDAVAAAAPLLLVFLLFGGPFVLGVVSAEARWSPERRLEPMLLLFGPLAAGVDKEEDEAELALLARKILCWYTSRLRAGIAFRRADTSKATPEGCC